ncbi:MAG: hypothetical protein HYS55_01415 [Candidatus Omnitrophica bacterium]|nr:hypothetical protein [Candidatus Omnitrophota bacterium]
MSIWLGKRKTIKQTFWLRLKTLVASFMGLVFLTSICFADGGYLTTYSHHIKRRELEVMVMNDFTFPSKPHHEEGERNYFSHMVEVEYAPFSQLALEFMTEWFEDVGKKDTKFTGFRYEARYRLFKQEVPLNPMVYVEYEDLDPETRYKMEVSGWVRPPYEDSAETTHPESSEVNRERIIETRVILSQDFLKHWNVAFNWINETDTSDGVTAFGYTTGVSYQFHTHHEEHGEHSHLSSHHRPFFSLASVALELTGAFGDTKDFGLEPSRQEHYVQPSVMIHMREHVMFNLGFGIGLTRSSDNLARFNVGIEF